MEEGREKTRCTKESAAEVGEDLNSCKAFPSARLGTTGASLIPTWSLLGVYAALKAASNCLPCFGLRKTAVVDWKEPGNETVKASTRLPTSKQVIKMRHFIAKASTGYENRWNKDVAIK